MQVLPHVQASSEGAYAGGMALSSQSLDLDTTWSHQVASVQENHDLTGKAVFCYLALLPQFVCELIVPDLSVTQPSYKRQRSRQASVKKAGEAWVVQVIFC